MLTLDQHSRDALFGELKNLADRRRAETFAEFSAVYSQPEEYFPRQLRDTVPCSPWTLAAGNIESDIMIVGLDWASEKYLAHAPMEAIAAGRDATLPTNKNLDAFIHSAFGLEFSEVYATNLFPFIKTGTMSARIPKRDLVVAGRKYVLPQIEALRPQVVIALGKDVAELLFEILVGGKAPFSKLIRGPQPTDLSTLCTVYHPGGHGTRNAGGKERALDYWKQYSALVQRGNEL